MAVKLIDLQLIYGVAGAREKFEDLVAQLVKREQPDASKVRPVQGDDGIDVHVGDLTDESGIDVYQCKFFPLGLGDSQKAKVRESFKRCRESHNFKLKRWTLCLPIDMSVVEKRWFEEWKKNQAAFGIVIEDPWTATKLESLLYLEKNCGLKEAYFREEHLTQIREMHHILRELLAEFVIRLPNPFERKPLKRVYEFPSSIVFNAETNLPDLLFQATTVGERLNSKARIAMPRDVVEEKCELSVDVPITDEMKDIHSLDSLQVKIVDDICSAQRGGELRRWVAGVGSSTKFITPITPEPITRIPGTEILSVLSNNRFAQDFMLKSKYQHSEIPFPEGTSIKLAEHPGGPGVGPAFRQVQIVVEGKASIVFSVRPSISGGFPQGVSILGGKIPRCRTFTYAVHVESQIIRAGIHDDIIQEYDAWIEWLVNELKSRNSDLEE